MMTNKDEILDRLIELKLILRKEYSVKEIGLFGSFTSEYFTPESDLDILVEFEKPIGWKFFSLEIFLENALGRKIDLVTRNAVKDRIRDSIFNQVKYI